MTLRELVFRGRVCAAETPQICPLPAHRQRNEACRRALSREQFDSVRLHVGLGYSAGVAGLASAISLENTSLYSDLQRSEAFMAKGQSISHTGSFGWSVLSGEIVWSNETFRIFECDPVTKPTLVLERTHPADRVFVRQTIERASSERGRLITGLQAALSMRTRCERRHPSSRPIAV
jgi:hypothetical protein